MNNLILRPIITAEEKSKFIGEIQEAFQKAYEEEFGKFSKTILPVKDIEDSFKAKGSKAYIAEVNGKRVGGTVVE